MRNPVHRMYFVLPSFIVPAGRSIFRWLLAVFYCFSVKWQYHQYNSFVWYSSPVFVFATLITHSNAKLNNTGDIGSPCRSPSCTADLLKFLPLIFILPSLCCSATLMIEISFIWMPNLCRHLNSISLLMVPYSCLMYLSSIHSFLPCISFNAKASFAETTLIF